MAAPLGDPSVSPEDYMILFLNENFDDNIRSLSRLQNTYKDVRDQKSNIEQRVFTSNKVVVRGIQL
jgi:hypothetical protein